MMISRIWLAMIIATSLAAGVGAGVMIRPGSLPAELVAATCEEVQQESKPILRNTKPHNSPSKEF